MGAKEKLIGIVLILLGAWPFLLKIESIGNFFAEYKFLTVLTPGEIVYQIAVVVLGVLLVWRVRTHITTAGPVR